MSAMILICFSLWSLFGVLSCESVSVTEGESVTLSVDLSETQRKGGINWKFGSAEITIAETEEQGIKAVLHDRRAEGRFRDRLKLDLNTGSLTINNIKTQHSGLYKVCSASKNIKLNTFNITVWARLPVPVINSSSSSVSKCSVLCSVVNVSNVSLSWYKGSSLLSSISVSDLNIINISLHLECVDDSYSCVLNNSISNQTQHLTTDLCHKCSEHSSTFIYFVIICCAGVGSLMIVTTLLVFHISRKHNNTNEDVHNQEEITYADPTFRKRNAHKAGGAVEDDVVYAGVKRR